MLIRAQAKKRSNYNTKILELTHCRVISNLINDFSLS